MFCVIADVVKPDLPRNASINKDGQGSSSMRPISYEHPGAPEYTSEVHYDDLND